MEKVIEQVQWRCNTNGLLREILDNNGMAVMLKPINIFGKLLGQVADRAVELNDDKLNALMCRLALYEEADPYSKNYDKEKTEKAIKKGMEE